MFDRKPKPGTRLPAGRLMVMCAPNGARLGKGDHPGVPLTGTELAGEAMSLKVAGVSVLHVHAREPVERSWRPCAGGWGTDWFCSSAPKR
jgi:hypothetical protein